MDRGQGARAGRGEETTTSAERPPCRPTPSTTRWRPSGVPDPSADAADDQVLGGAAVATEFVATSCAVAVGATPNAGKQPALVVGCERQQGRHPRPVRRPRRQPGARRRGGGGRVGVDQVRGRSRRHCGRG
ncbi:hypothetical protein BU14_0227s0018 [Porphyra umbilicalis]|uniref:Uncharacterized protein n=1 Tax=Porphyra umbilicalis TaxID=2786 RepID=A0A1X6P462_PORUM|nr:hypothetical protein BU14_0227s0018 [Porphyra umbilicalis]|eukprot:OSX75679.1 hypothetical protein BU14_0227s0018 [Porphyra umbilicalis]